MTFAAKLQAQNMDDSCSFTGSEQILLPGSPETDSEENERRVEVVLREMLADERLYRTSYRHVIYTIVVIVRYFVQVSHT